MKINRYLISVRISQGLAIPFSTVSPSARLPDIIAAIPPSLGSMVQATPKPVTGFNGLPPFIAMPQSSAQLTDRISHSPTLLEDSVNEVEKDNFYQVRIKISFSRSTVHEIKKTKILFLLKVKFLFRLYTYCSMHLFYRYRYPPTKRFQP